MIHLILFLSLFHHSSPRDQFIKETLNELRAASIQAGDYPVITALDVMYVTRAETDINNARDALKRYKHGHISEQDVRTVVSQLERDLEDIPPAPAVPVPDSRPTA